MGDPQKYAVAYNRLCRLADDFCTTLWEMKINGGPGEQSWLLPQNIFIDGRHVGTVFLNAITAEVYRVHYKRVRRRKTAERAPSAALQRKMYGLGLYPGMMREGK